MKDTNTTALTGRNALVTGGARGIGRACCEALARAGVNVAIHCRTSTGPAEQTARAVSAHGVRSHVVRADVSSEAEVHAMVQGVNDALGPVDLLVNSAGIFDYVSHQDTTAELWRRTLDVNLTGTFLVTWAVKQDMVERRYGRIVNITSIGGLRARPMSIAYSASKAGVVGFTKSTAEALAPLGIRVNAVAPGLIDTEMIADVEPDVREKLVQATPAGRIGEPEDIARVVLFLLSDASNFITGQTVVASGGRVMLP